MNMLVFCVIVVLFDISIAVDPVSLALQQNNATDLSKLITSVNSNCIDKNSSCGLLEIQFHICSSDASSDSFVVASRDCKLTCGVCPVFSGNVTIFAPVDGSFAVNDLMNLTSKASTFIKRLTVKGHIHLTDLRDGHDLVDIMGNKIRINVIKGYHHEPNTILLNGVKILRGDIVAGGDIVHITQGFIETKQDILEILQGMNDAHDFLALLKRTGLDNMFSNPHSHYTVFLPTNYAFATNGVNLLRAKNSTHIQEVVKFHILRRTLLTDGLPNHAINKNTLMTIDNQHLHIDKQPDNIVVNNIAHITTSDIIASNGVIHIIDHVLYPTILPPDVLG